MTPRIDLLRQRLAEGALDLADLFRWWMRGDVEAGAILVEREDADPDAAALVRAGLRVHRARQEQAVREHNAEMFREAEASW